MVQVYEKKNLKEKNKNPQPYLLFIFLLFVTRNQPLPLISVSELLGLWLSKRG